MTHAREVGNGRSARLPGAFDLDPHELVASHMLEHASKRSHRMTDTTDHRSAM
jgi:hypothetical protein